MAARCFSIKRFLATCLLSSVVLLSGCGSTTNALVPAASAQSVPLFPQITQTSPTFVKWDLFADEVSRRFVLIGVAGCNNENESNDPSTCQGVLGDAARPGLGPMQFELTPPRLPFANYCIDTLKLGTKQPVTDVNRNWVVPSAAGPALHPDAVSILAVSTLPGRGQPSVSVRHDDGILHIDKMCYPHYGDAFPHVWLLNNWQDNQVMTWVIAGEIRT
jgi:hypothetical protein